MAINFRNFKPSLLRAINHDKGQRFKNEVRRNIQMSFSKLQNKSKRLIGSTAFFRVFEQSVKFTIHHPIYTLFFI
ncbi:hypothetical protein HW132_25580 [Brasilonema sp. CT11]|nr:hypothetical protein [Brasilonema sp. CT11]